MYCGDVKTAPTADDAEYRAIVAMHPSDAAPTAERPYETAEREAIADGAERGASAGRSAAITAIGTYNDPAAFAREWLRADGAGDFMRAPRGSGGMPFDGARAMPFGWDRTEPYDYVPSAPLSGEWAGDPLPRDIAERFMPNERPDGMTDDGMASGDASAWDDDAAAIVDAWETAWETAASDAFGAYMRAYVTDADGDPGTADGAESDGRVTE